MFSIFTHPKRTEPHVAPRRTTDRAVSPVIGGILMFGLVIAMMSLIQVTGVPVWNAQEEFHHSQAVQAEFQTLDRAVEDVATTGNSQSVVLDTGMDYPTRPFLFNPPSVTGQLQVQPAGSIGITNAAVVHNTNYWSKTVTTNPTFATSTVRYTPGYRQYQGAPETYYEHGVLYNRFADGTVIPVGESSLVDGREISIVVLDGQLSTASSAPTTLDLRGLSGPAQTTTITSRDSSGIVLTLPTEFDRDTWLDLLADQVDDPDHPMSYDPTDGAYITGLDVSSGVLTLTMEPGSYDLRLAKVGIGSGYTEESARYVTAVEGDGTVVVSGSAASLAAQVRDQYNNPKSGVLLTFEVDDGSGAFVESDGKVISSTSVEVMTDSTGTALINFRPTVEEGQEDVTVSLIASSDLDGSGSIDSFEKATFNLEAISPVTSGYSEYAGSLNPYGSKSIVLQQAERTQICGTGNEKADCEIKITFKNLDDDPASERYVQEVRVNFYSGNTISQGSQLVAADYAEIVDATGENVLYSPLEVGGGFVPIDSPGGSTSNPITISGDDPTDVYLRFYYQESGTNYPFQLDEGEFFALTVVFDNGRTGTYLVGVSNN